MGRRVDVLALVACLVLAAVTLGLAWAPAPPPTAGAQVTDVLAAPPPPRQAGPAGPAREGAPIPQTTAAAEPAPPVRVEVPSLDISAEVVPVGVRDDGAFDVPDDGDVVGWYRYGSTPGGAAGSAVLAGHVDTRADGPGALFDLRRLAVGDDVVVVTDRGPLRYRVTGRDSVVKAALPVEQLFARDGAHRLVLVTCGGRFVPERRSYEENVVVVAEPVP